MYRRAPSRHRSPPALPPVLNEASRLRSSTRSSLPSQCGCMPCFLAWCQIVGQSAVPSSSSVRRSSAGRLNKGFAELKVSTSPGPQSDWALRKRSDRAGRAHRHALVVRDAACWPGTPSNARRHDEVGQSRLHERREQVICHCGGVDGVFY